MPQPNSPSTIGMLAAQLGELVERKNAVYGNSVERSAEILRVLYPAGVAPVDYKDMLLVVRIIDKLARIANGARQDSYIDIAGYGLLGTLNNPERTEEESCRNAAIAER